MHKPFLPKISKQWQLHKFLQKCFLFSMDCLPAIHHDQGREFESRQIKELLGMLGICKSHTAPYHPQGDSQAEHFNITLLSVLSTLDPYKKSSLNQHIDPLVHAYCSTVQRMRPLATLPFTSCLSRVLSAC